MLMLLEVQATCSGKIEQEEPKHYPVDILIKFRAKS